MESFIIHTGSFLFKCEAAKLEILHGFVELLRKGVDFQAVSNSARGNKRRVSFVGSGAITESRLTL